MPPRFAETSFSNEVFEVAARDVPRRSDRPRFLTEPHASYELHSIDAFGEDPVTNARHVSWQSVLIEGDEPIAIIEASPNVMGALSRPTVVVGDLPARLVAALADAERNQLVGAGDDFAVLSIAQVGFTALWLPEQHVLMSVGPDVHSAMRRGDVHNDHDVRLIVRNIFAMQ